jgi:nucleoid-associated protein YgaU
VYEHNRAKFANPDKLPVGQQLVVPAAAELARRYPALCPKERKAPAGRRLAVQTSAQQPIGTRSYVVAEGDTLFDIARYELGKASRWAEIYDLNRELLGDDFDFLHPGTELTIPAKAKAAESYTRQPQGTLTR